MANSRFTSGALPTASSALSTTSSALSLTSSALSLTSGGLPFLLALILALGGCSFSLDLRGGTLVNPEDPLSAESVRNSRELSFRIYQLKSHENLQQVLTTPWESFTATEIPESLKPFLVVPADTAPQLRPQEDFFIRRQQRKRFHFPLLKGTSALLVVARGRQPGESSLQLVQVGTFTREVALCFHKYDVFVNQRTWPCAKDGWGDGE